MQASSRTKSKSMSSSEDDLLDTEISSGISKKHFLDYDYDHQPSTPPTGTTYATAAAIGDESHGKINDASRSKANTINSNCTNQLMEPKKISDRPSTSATKAASATMEQQLNVSTKPNLTPSSSSSSSMPNNVDSVYSILSMLGGSNNTTSDITSKFLEFSKNREMCATLRLSGCISLLVQIIHSDPTEARQKECLQTLHNIIHCHPDDKVGRREARVLKLIEQLFDYCDALRAILQHELADNIDRYPIQAIGTLMKISFDEEHRYAMCQLGALQTISTLIQLDHSVHGPVSTEANCITMRRYAGMCLTNLTFGDGNNKALLCSNKNFMRALVDQINSTSDELVQVTASVIRNLSWRADANMKEVLNEIGTMKILTLAAMKCSQENTLKAILSALWNLSNHCAKNKAEFCEITGAIEFLVDMLSYDAPSKTMAVIENAGGILRNISSHIAMSEECRVVLRRKNCFNILLQQLKSPSLTVVSNACGTLGNLSSHCVEDQKYLRDNGAIPMLRSLIYSKHKMISTGSTIALRHLLACKSSVAHNDNLDSVAKMMDLKELPTLNVRKQRALEHELSLSTAHYDIDDTSPSTKDDKTRDFAVTSKTKANRLKVQDIEDEEEEAPTNFSKFDNDEQETERTTYQETNLDQITDYSARYVENQSDSEEEQQKPALVADDTTKCYNTEGTPRAVLSGAASMSDLRKEKLKESVKATENAKLKDKFSANASGMQSPEKTVNYCVEGTPGNFSRNDSLSDLEEGVAKGDKPGPSRTIPVVGSKIPPPLMIRKEVPSEKESVAATPKSVTFGAEETPLMFSRTSSMGSLSSAEPACVDDKSSVVSDFSRLASGIISPSELPDSPTQSVPQSPSRLQAKPRSVPVIKTPPLPAARREVIGSEAEAADDTTNTFLVENTPAVFSYATSLSNLSFDDEPKISTDAISKDFQLMKHPSTDEDDEHRTKTSSQPPDTADQSDAESAEDDQLLESCINMGMNRAARIDRIDLSAGKITRADILDNGSSTSDVDDQIILEACIRDGMPKIPMHLIKENPVDMMRAGAPLLPPYLPVVDEFNRFTVEDSPCNFSVMSGLSAITIESNLNSSKPTAKVEPTVRDEAAGSSKVAPLRSSHDFEDSLSSLSIESEDDGHLLSQAIAAGINAAKHDAPTAPINIPAKPRASQEMCNDSISSVDSCDKDDASNSILEQCIRTGINKVVKKETRPLMTSSPKRSALPKPKVDKDKRTQAKKDEELLEECINTGILSNTRQDHHHTLVQNFTHMSISEPKNGETTSVTRKDRVPVTGVEAKLESQQQPMNHSSSMDQEIAFNRINKIDQQEESFASRSEHSHPASWTTPNGYNSSFELNLSLGSLEDNVLERSNEYPAIKLSGVYPELEDDSIMEMSNEFMVDNEKIAEARIEDKHKDPDLMLKSVDRLTHELVSTAEYLRKNISNSDETSEQKMSGSTSNNNTWNDENSFPSISMTAPMIASTNDDVTIATDQLYPLPEEMSVQLLDDKTPTNENFKFGEKNDACDGPKIEFKLGGELNTQPLSRINLLSFGPTSIETCSTMSNSTIVQVEAKAIANRISSMTNKLMDSTTSLDLENVQPPSSMDCISLNSYQDTSIQQSPFKGQPKRSFLTGLVAKRALGHQVYGGSVESVNSINNIESIRPPSCMDELLDSMISVDSIVSEMVDPTFGISQYETALSDMEDSLTLRSCQDLSKDDTLTIMSSDDFSSVESTPKKKRSQRAATPKQKRQVEKDRYKTYTIAVDMLLKEQEKVERTEDAASRRALNARQRRQEDRQRFETQVISPSPDSKSPIRNTRRRDDPDRFKTHTIEIDDDLSIRAMTANFEFIRNGIIPSSGSSVDTAGLRSKLNRIKSSTNGSSPSSDSLEYERQNSETESQRDQRNSLNYETNSSIERESGSTPTPQQQESPKLRQSKSSYISPYRMTTTRLTPTKSKSTGKVTKSPIIAKVISTKNNGNGLDLKLQNQSPKGRFSRVSVSAKATPTSSIPKPATTPTALEAPAMPIRQGTFIKDEPSIENVPVVNDPPSPVMTPVSKLKPPSRVPSASKIPATPTTPKKASNLPSSIAQLKYRSNSNASMKAKEIAAPIRSNTGISLNNPKKNVTSKIAGIWKSAEKKEPMTRKPISTSSTQLNYGSKLSTPSSGGKKIASSANKDIMKRSSTFNEIV